MDRHPRLTCWLRLQFMFYRRTAASDRAAIVAWKSQPEHTGSVGMSSPWMWYPPVVEALGWPRKPGRHPHHAAFAAVNLFMICAAAAAVTELSIRGSTRIALSWAEVGLQDATVFDRLVHIVVWFAASYVWENVAEYVWHRVMHTRWFYSHFHCHHHFYTSPEPFDDLCIHPVEAFGYYCILYAPAMLFRQHWLAFFVYMSWMGICGVLDHSGVRFDLPWLIYSASDHDAHHKYFTVNFGFPSPLIDVLCGTHRPMEPPSVSSVDTSTASTGRPRSVSRANRS